MEIRTFQGGKRSQAKLSNLITKNERIYPLVICYIAIEHDPVEIVDLLIKNRDFP